MIVSINEKLKRYGIIAGSIFAVVFLMVLLRIGFVISLDKGITSWFGGLASGVGDALMLVVSTLGSTQMGLVYSLLLGAILWLSNLKIPALWVVATYLSSLVIGWIIKNVVGRDRPMGHQSNDSGPSFVSGHVLATTVIVMMLFVLVIPNMSKQSTRNWVAFALGLFILLLAESRLYFQAHYLTDIIGAITLGIAWVVLCVWLYQRFAYMLRRLNYFANEDI